MELGDPLPGNIVHVRGKIQEALPVIAAELQAAGRRKSSAYSSSAHSSSSSAYCPARATSQLYVLVCLCACVRQSWTSSSRISAPTTTYERFVCTCSSLSGNRSLYLVRCCAPDRLSGCYRTATALLSDGADGGLAPATERRHPPARWADDRDLQVWQWLYGGDVG
eukprot:COSAG06_NODE_26_length_32102_cov_250.952911_10_plen_166_part_00